MSSSSSELLIGILEFNKMLSQIISLYITSQDFKESITLTLQSKKHKCTSHDVSQKKLLFSTMGDMSDHPYREWHTISLQYGPWRSNEKWWLISESSENKHLPDPISHKQGV